MRVMIQLRQDVALDLQNRLSGASTAPKGNPKMEQLLHAAAELGVRIQPVHPGQTHPLLAPYFMVETRDRKTAEQIINAFKQFDFVEAAYLGPEEQLPNQ
jgi:hypothetical protein